MNMEQELQDLQAENVRLCAALVAAHDIHETLRDDIRQIEAENARLSVVLAQSDQPCAYCSLPRDEWPKCAAGFPGCSRFDDSLGCPELGARLKVEQLEAEIVRLRAAIEAVPEPINILFDGPPGPEAGLRFIEIENDAGRSISIGEWTERGDYWVLRIESLPTRGQNVPRGT